MVSARVIASRTLYWSGIVCIVGAIGLVLASARAADAPATGPVGMWVGFALGLAGIGLTARGATMKRY